MNNDNGNKYFKLIDEITTVRRDTITPILKISQREGLKNLSNLLTEKEKESKFVTQNYNLDSQIEKEYILPQFVSSLLDVSQSDIYRGKFILLYGKTGTGKTTFVKEFVKFNNLKYTMINYNTIFSHRLGETQRNLKRIIKDSSREFDVVLFDEIDSLVSTRSATNDVGEMSRITSSFILLMDSIIEENNNCIFFLTTNMIDSIDKAILRRIDLEINFDKYSKEEMSLIIERYFHEIKALKILEKTRPSFRYPSKILKFISSELLLHNLSPAENIKVISKIFMNPLKINIGYFLIELDKKRYLKYENVQKEMSREDYKKIFGGIIK